MFLSCAINTSWFAKLDKTLHRSFIGVSHAGREDEPCMLLCGPFSDVNINLGYKYNFNGFIKHKCN